MLYTVLLRLMLKFTMEKGKGKILFIEALMIKSDRIGSLDLREADFERKIMKELIAEVIEQSMNEVTNEESHNVVLAISPPVAVA